MTRVVAVMNPAGSSAKSTTVAALAHLAAEAGQRVLAVDVDVQGNLTKLLGGVSDTASITHAMQAVAIEWPGLSEDEVAADRRRAVARTIQQSPFGPDLMASDPGLEGLVVQVTQKPGLLRHVLAAAPDYDLVLLDCKGDLAAMSREAMLAADEVVCVVAAVGKSVEGIAALDVAATRGDIPFRAIVPSKIQPRNRGADADDVRRFIVEMYADRLTPAVRMAATVEGAFNAGEPVTAYDPRSDVAADLRAVWTHLRDEGVLP